MDYTIASPDQLFAALEQAGRYPASGLIAACLDRGDELASGLLAMLAEGEKAGYEENWPGDDPRWYRGIHAGRLLIALREEKALPLFEGILREDEDASAVEWYESELPYYGPPALPMLTRLIRDASAAPSARMAAAMMLKNIAHLHADTKPDVTATLRTVLPPLSDRGEPVVPDAVDDDQRGLWTFAAFALALLGEADSQAHVEALHDWYLIDESVYGDFEGYQKVLHAGDDPFALPPTFDLARAYAHEDEDEYPESEAGPDDGAGDPDTLMGYGSEATYVRAEPKIGRNDPCPCGSGRKYKHCCGGR